MTTQAEKVGGLSKEQWSADYQKAQEDKPKEGDILRCLGEEELIRLDVELTDGKPPFVYGRVYVPCVFGLPTGWFMHPISAEYVYGVKCILLPKAREDLFKEKGISDMVGVKAIRVVRWSKSGHSLLCEVEEY